MVGPEEYDVPAMRPLPLRVILGFDVFEHLDDVHIRLQLQLRSCVWYIDEGVGNLATF